MMIKLTFGELAVITDTLQRSLSVVNWGGFEKETRDALLTKLYNADLCFELEVKKGDHADT